MTRRHGRCRRCERLRSGVSHGHWKTTTLVAGLRRTGMVTRMVHDGPINLDAFVAYVRQMLVLELMPGDIVIVDNLPSHNAPDAWKAIEAAGATLLSATAMRQLLRKRRIRCRMIGNRSNATPSRRAFQGPR